MASARDIADEHLAREAELDPVEATHRGLLGHDAEMTDYSPEGIAARTELARRTRAALNDATVEGDEQRRCRDLLAERLDADLALADAGEQFRTLRILASPIQDPRDVFDLMARDTTADWEVIARRMEKIPEALRGVQATLAEGLQRGLPAPRRQALACAEQAAVWAGEREALAFFVGLAGHARTEDGELPAALGARLEKAAQQATQAYGRLGAFLRDEYAIHAASADGAGEERYRLSARQFLGCDVDLGATYAWGWDELRRIEQDMTETARRIAPDGTVDDAVRLLETDSARAIEGVDSLRGWLQELMDATIDELDGTHFDIPAPVRRVDAMISPPGGAAAMYYTGPSEDFSRPGRTWYPTLGRTRFPMWREVSTAYHEGVPGHHLQVAQVIYLGERLSAYQRVTWVSGHGEGWALYAERLMDELGYLENPDYRLGMLAAQALRAARVVVDIGMHLQYRIPADETFHPGEQWTPELGRAFVEQHNRSEAEFVASEIIRYLGWPGQAISYKVGERVWLEARQEARQRQGQRFDLKRFHAQALDLGSLGLEQFRREMALI